MSATETTVNGQTYRIGRMLPMKQGHVTRRLAPALARLAPAMSGLAAAKDLKGQTDALLPFADALSMMSDADFEYVVIACLGVVHGSTDGGKTWGPLYQGDVCMRTDLDLATLLPLTINVIRTSLGPFIAGFLTSPAPGEVPA